MEFIDHTGHIFSQPSYKTYPTGYEYETFKYIFYLEDEYARRLSINEWYIRPIRLLIHKCDGDIASLSANIDSTVFKLLSPSMIQEKINEGLPLEIEEDAFTDSLSYDDMMPLEDNNDIMLTIYVGGYAKSPATWTSNILIECEYSDGHKEWCPITVGGVFYDEQEELVINGRNMGVSFPKDIIRALYPKTAGTSIYTDETNEAVYNMKIKEYMMNYMRLHGECGNIDQIKSSLAFFEWGNTISLAQLIRTDNEIITQYIKNYLDINNDVLQRMDHFSPTALLSLVVKENDETDKEYNADFNKSFWGEMKPVLEDLFSKLVPVKYDEMDITFYKPYYDYVFTEMMLKLSCLRYYYQKYFLPMQSMILSASVQHKVFANDIKYLAKSFIQLTEKPLVAETNRAYFDVIFPQDKSLYAYTQKKYVDSNLNSFTNYEGEGPLLEEETIYYIDDVCIDVPIKFIVHEPGMNYFKCHLILEMLNGPVLFETDFAFSQTETSDYESLVIYPKLINFMKTMNYWEGKHYCIHLLVNDVWFDWEFMIKVPELHMSFGKLEYHYDNALFRQVNSISNDVDFQSFMYLPSLVDVNNIRFPQEVVAYGHDGVMEKFIDMYRDKPFIVSTGDLAKRYYNRVHYYKIVVNGEEMQYTGDEDLGNLYRNFFTEDGTQKQSLKKDGLEYDLYLMHDSTDTNDYKGVLTEDEFDALGCPCWYIILISKETVDNADSDVMSAPKIIPVGDMKFAYQKSDNKWLINRMIYIPANGINHFKKDDIIVGTITNVDLPFILIDGSKWKLSPMSVGMQADSEVQSKTNTFLMSIGGDNTGYDPGYYNITVRYSIDGTVHSQREHTARILVER